MYGSHRGRTRTLSQRVDTLMRALISICLVVCLFVFPDVAPATDYKPWYGRVLELDLSADVLMQAFTHVDSHHSSGKHPEFDTFIDAAASSAIWESIAAELEVIAAETRYQSFGMDAVRLTGRYRWFNDIVGDPISLSTGVTLSTIFKPARRNIATFDHGGMAAEGHIAVGKEFSREELWTSRAWGVFGMGIADVGSPWLRFNAAWEHNWCDRHQLELFTDTVWGLGQNQLNLHNFHGYGSVNYQAIDLGVRYHRQFDYGLILSLGYAYRVYSRNCPQEVNLISIKVFYPL